MMDTLVRREHLETSANPNPRIDYVVDLTGELATLCRIEIRYIPDKALIEPTSLARYFGALGALRWPRLEDVALSVVSDINNEIVPRWVRVVVSGLDGGLSHSVTIEDRQPHWDNPALLSRIRAG